MQVQSRGYCKGFSHSSLVAYSSKIPPRGALAGEIVHNPALNFMHRESEMPECFTDSRDLLT